MDLTPAQSSTLQKLLRGGFKFVSLERYGRFIAVEKKSFVALLEPAGGKLRIFTELGYRLGDGIGMLVERAEGKAFVWHGKTMPASPELLATYARIKSELKALVEKSESDG